jgi:hypothetical protein
MPANIPHFAHRLELRTRATPVNAADRHVAIVSDRAGQWRRLFDTSSDTYRFVIDPQPTASTELVVWDHDQAPPDGLRAPLWWVAKPDAFPELAKAREVDGLRYADSSRGRLWTSAAWPPKDVDSARALLVDWQRLHHAPTPFTLPSQVIAPTRPDRAGEAEGALRDMLVLVIAGLFALERILAHARRR